MIQKLTAWLEANPGIAFFPLWLPLEQAFGMSKRHASAHYIKQLGRALRHLGWRSATRRVAGTVVRGWVRG